MDRTTDHEGRSMTVPVVERWHGTYNGYCRHACRCPDCREANSIRSKNYKARVSGRVGDLRHLRPELHCGDCRYTCELAVDMHEHTLRTHGRRLSDAERTPRKVET
jgi:hypothetical protein